MPEPENRKPRRPLKNLPPDRLQPKVWLIWLMLGAAVLALLVWPPTSQIAAANITIQDVLDLTQQKQIKHGTIT
ncbi:MAG: cell division protein FtsH, partial [Opitutaceae bacterium]